MALTFKMGAQNKQKRRKLGRPKKDRTLSPAQRKVLEDLYYTEFRSAIGMRAAWAALRDNPQQKASIDAGDQTFWIPWATFKQWYNSQEVAQLMRRAPTVSETRATIPAELVPLAYMQADCLDFGDLSYNGRRYVMNLVDTVTGFSVQQTWRGNLNARQTSRIVQEFVDVIRQWQGNWPRATELRCDNGQEFGAEFKQAVETYEPLISVTHGVANRPNSQAAVETSNGVFRGVLRRLMRSKGLPQKQWPNHIVEAGYIMNTRPSVRLNWESPADAFNAFFGNSPQDQATVVKVQTAIREDLNARRGPGTTHQTPYNVGDSVRLANDYYMKTAKSVRGNVSKQGPRWSVTVYTILKRQRPGPAAPWQYKISDGKNIWHQHELLMQIDAVEPPPNAATAARTDYKFETILDYNRQTQKYLVLYTGYWQPEWEFRANVPANLRAVWHQANP